jgi:hypothetical protein
MDIIGARDVGHRFTGVPASERFPLLVGSELGTSSKLDPLGNCSCPTFSRSPNQLALELGKPSENSQHQSTVRGGRVGPGVTKRSKSGTLLSELGQNIQQITSGAGKTIQPRDDNRVALHDGVQKLRKLRAVNPCPCSAWLRKLMPRPFHPQQDLCDLHQQLTEVLAVEQAKKRGRDLAAGGRQRVAVRPGRSSCVTVPVRLDNGA